MSSAAQTYYKAARDEVVMRIRLREQALHYFLVSSAAILSLAFATISSVGGTIVLIIPFVSLGTAIFIANHHIAITNIGKYAGYLRKAIDKCRTIHYENEYPGKTPPELVPWDVCDVYKTEGKLSSRLRFLGNLAIIIAPSLLALVIGFLQIDIYEKDKSEHIMVQQSLGAYLDGSIEDYQLPHSILGVFDWDDSSTDKKKKQSIMKYRDDVMQNQLPTATFMLHIQMLLFWSTLFLALVTAAVIYYSHYVRMKLHANIPEEPSSG